MPEYTPGPFHVALDEKCMHSPHIHVKCGKCTVADVHLFGGAGPANARLFAAAPDLDEAARCLVLNAVLAGDPRMGGATDCYLVPMDDVDALRAAIGKVKGDSDV